MCYVRSCRRTDRSIRYPRTPTTAVTPTTTSVMIATNGMLHLEGYRAPLTRGLAASDRIADERQHAAVIHDADPQHERRDGHRLRERWCVAFGLHRPRAVVRGEVETVE